MKLLIFEYSTCLNYDKLLSEGLNMLNSILLDLHDDKRYEISCLINNNVKIKKYPQIKYIPIKNELFNWLKENSNNYEYCIFIAPDNNLILYKITKILEENHVKIIGSNSNATYICSSKIKTYKKIPSDIQKIPTKKISTTNPNYEKINKYLKNNEIVLKPDNQTSSIMIYKINDISDFKKIIKKFEKENIKEAIVQPYISGEHISISLIYNKKEIQFLSINKEYVEIKENKIKFIGCKSPIKHEKTTEIISITKKIIKNINGLNGFIGIDYIVKDDQIFFVEINPRITTPYIILQKNTNKNLTKNMLEFILDNKKNEIKLINTGEFIL